MRIARLLWPGLVVALLGLPIAFALLQRVPHVNDFEIIEPAAGWTSVFVALGHTTGDAGVHTARKTIWQSGTPGLQAHDEVRLLMVGAPVTLNRGEIRVTGTDCVYRTAPGAAIVNGGYLAFTRLQPCALPDRDRQQELELTLTFRGDGRVGLATYFVPPAITGSGWLSLTAPNSADARPVPIARGRYVDYLPGEPVRRVDLLAYMWNLGRSSLWIWAAIALALAVLFMGLVGVGANGATLPRVSLGVGAIGLSLAMLYAVLVPPLQAPDEPDHLLAFAQVAGRPQLTDSLAALARRGHFDRIHFRPAERFRQVDVAQPSAVHWNADVFAHVVAGRSRTTWLWWKMLAPVVGKATAAQATLALRFANAAVFALCLALAAALLLWTVRTRVTAPHAVCLALLVIPTLPFFATHVSEFALLTSAYVVLAAAVAALFLDGDRAHWLGLPVGLATSLILAGGRSGLPFVATLATVIGGRALLGSRLTPPPDGEASPPDAHHDTRRAMIFWAGLGLGLAVFVVLATPDFRAGLWPGDVTSVPDWFKAVAEWLRDHPWSVAIVIPIGLGIEIAATRIRRGIPAAGRLAAGAVRAACGLAAAGVLTSVLVSAVARYPVLAAREVMPPATAASYAEDVMRVALTGFRLENHDWLLSTSFWAGFGWLDTVPGGRFVSMLVALAAAACVTLLLQIARTPDIRRATWLVLLGLGWLATLIAYAVSSYYLNRNLHGRYLVGLYLTMLAVSCSALALWPKRSGVDASRSGPGREEVTVAFSAVVHAYALHFVLLRYF